MPLTCSQANKKILYESKIVAVDEAGESSLVDV